MVEARYIKLGLIIILMVFILGVFYFLDLIIITPGECIETEEPFCPYVLFEEDIYILPDSELAVIAEEVEADLEEMMPGYGFELWIEDGCVHSCRYYIGDDG